MNNQEKNEEYIHKSQHINYLHEIIEKIQDRVAHKYEEDLKIAENKLKKLLGDRVTNNMKSIDKLIDSLNNENTSREEIAKAIEECIDTFYELVGPLMPDYEYEDEGWIYSL